MILTKKIEVKINSSNFNHFKKMGYLNIRCRNIILVDVSDLMHKSNIDIEVKCDICNNIKFIHYSSYVKNIEKYGIYSCSNSCSSFKNKLTNKERYGDENYTNRDLAKQTYSNIFGVNNPFKSEVIKNKIKKYYQDTFKVDSHNQLEIIKNKKKETFLKNYGMDSYFKTDEFKKNMDYTKIGFNSNKYKNICIKKYGGVPSSTKIIKNKISKTNKITFLKNQLISFDIKDYILIGIDFENREYILKHSVCNSIFHISYSLLKNRKKLNTILCTKCNNISKSISGKELQLLEFIKDNYNDEIQENKRNIISPFELDIYLPDLNLAFEFNGVYWHNELYKDKNYHLNKTELCDKQGIQLIHIWEDDWLYKKDIVKSMILNKLNLNSNKIYAIKTKVLEINDNKLIRKFLDDNHIQGFIDSSFEFGLYYENELVSLMTFGKKRSSQNSKNKESEYELLRFCNKKYNSVIGGASKLFNYFKLNYNPKEIITYANLSYSNGNLYKELGMDFVSRTQPNYHYVVDGIRKHNSGIRKDVLIKESFDKNKSEHEIMLERKIYRIYNSGNLKYKYKQ